MQSHTQLIFILEFLFLAYLAAYLHICWLTCIYSNDELYSSFATYTVWYDRFNQKVADRHIPVCSSIRAKPTMLLRGSGMGPGQATHSAHNKTYTSLTRNAFWFFFKFKFFPIFRRHRNTFEVVLLLSWLYHRACCAAHLSLDVCSVRNESYVPFSIT